MIIGLIAIKIYEIAIFGNTEFAFKLIQGNKWAWGEISIVMTIWLEYFENY